MCWWQHLAVPSRIWSTSKAHNWVESRLLHTARIPHMRKLIFNFSNVSAWLWFQQRRRQSAPWIIKFGPWTRDFDMWYVDIFHQRTAAARNKQKCDWDDFNCLLNENRYALSMQCSLEHENDESRVFPSLSLSHPLPLSPSPPSLSSTLLLPCAKLMMSQFRCANSPFRQNIFRFYVNCICWMLTYVSISDSDYVYTIGMHSTVYTFTGLAFVLADDAPNQNSLHIIIIRSSTFDIQTN